ncbi:MAG: class I SAM-dependent methyltransferase [Heliobacteriaceae bacterium]|nr:class I SAM-dependent methyltransferase [Heliobacteriaceae bacterium]
MAKRKTLFIGCGDGREILPLANHQEYLLIGLEPSDQQYAKATEALRGFPNVRIIKRRIQDWEAVEYEGDIDRIYFIFPTPVVLRDQAEEIIAKACFLLSKDGGRFHTFTEVTLSRWPDPGDKAALQEFLRVLGDGRLSVSRNEISFDELPRMVKESYCGVLFKKHNLSPFTAIEARKP